jgi:hypothetical protein
MVGWANSAAVPGLEAAHPDRATALLASEAVKAQITAKIGAWLARLCGLLTVGQG